MGQGVRGENGKAESGAKKGMYRLEFVDDGGQIHEVDANLVVKVSPGRRAELISVSVCLDQLVLLVAVSAQTVRYRVLHPV